MTAYDPHAEVQVIEVVITRLLLRGKGTPDSIMRRVVQVWTTDGVLIAEHDIEEKKVL
jgi:hypothetical protein